VDRRWQRATRHVLRHRYPILCAWLVFCVGRQVAQGIDWGWFTLGSSLLFGREPPPGFPRYLGPPPEGAGGLHTYATEPDLHMGPVSLVAAAFFRFLFPHEGRIAAMVAAAALGPLLIFLVERTAVELRGLRDPFERPLLPLTTLIGGGAFLLAWTQAAWTWAHLDEVLVVAAAAVAVWCVATGRAALAGITVGLAIGAKSWAILLLPLLAAFPWQRTLRAAVLATCVAAVIWLPFLIADAGTLDALRASIIVRPGSGLYAFGIDGGQAPDWLRPLQVLAGLAVGAVAVLRGRWQAVLLLALGVRLATDPTLFPYYTAALVMGALVWDLVGSTRALPLWTPVMAFAFQAIHRLTSDPYVLGTVRVGVVGLMVVLLLAGVRRRGQPKRV
jgi:hypothetical protein